ncbi:hypothetical protein M5X00_26020 [Paenibacillus alvei]|uniref:hypothetical protein n=1 Tax=Paenibacillus alvei TaxID=44250 RepID=UPI00227FE37B|nr:hypothetical protein [Paenibacillus alvei]MCY9757688.1 hypothetical protein [Paenibacillus alvei]
MKTGYKKQYPKFYEAWQNMKKRCNNPKSANYKYYGGRGITYDSKWETIEGFYQDMFSTWKEGLTLDRVEVDGHYCKDNCRWVPFIDQCYNRRSNRMITINGVTKHLTEWSKMTGIPVTTIWSRYSAGDRDDALIRRGVN